MAGLRFKSYTAEDFLAAYGLLAGDCRILNAGSAGVRYGRRCVNVDIQGGPGVDLVCDIQALPESLGDLDAVVCNAALQYCQAPQRAADEFHRVLKPGGYVFVDAPWVQPYCPDTPDRFRFSQDALRALFAAFDILECGPSIPSGSALYMLAVRIAGNLTRSRVANRALRGVAAVVCLPLIGTSTVQESHTAGAFYLVGRKR